MVKQNTKIQAVPRTLPPFSSVSVRCETFWDHIHIEYTGAIRDLIECGAIDPSMAVSARKGIRRVDSHGDGFRQKPLADRRLHVERSISDIDRALGLPGVYLDQESEIAQLLAKPGQVIYEQRGCWHIWFGAKESLAREGLGIACGTVRPGLRGFLRLSWCEDYPNDPRPLSARRTEAVNKARSDISCECISTLLKGAMIMACNEVSRVGLTIIPTDQAAWMVLTDNIVAQLDAFARNVRIESANRPQLRLVKPDVAHGPAQDGESVGSRLCAPVFGREPLPAT